jgi:hypothetical protein
MIDVYNKIFSFIMDDNVCSIIMDDNDSNNIIKHDELQESSS